MKQGYSIVEAMVIVTIIGILATLGYSQFKYHVAKARQAEAKNNLKHLAMLQESYFMEHGKYSWMKSIGLKRKGSGAYACRTDRPGEEMLNELGFRPSNCEKLRYEYWMPPKWEYGAPLNEPQFKVTEKYIIRADNIPTDNSGIYIWPGCGKRDQMKVQYNPARKEEDIKHPFSSRNVLEAC